MLSSAYSPSILTLKLTYTHTSLSYSHSQHMYPTILKIQKVTTYNQVLTATAAVYTVYVY